MSRTIFAITLTYTIFCCVAWEFAWQSMGGASFTTCSGFFWTDDSSDSSGKEPGK